MGALIDTVFRNAGDITATVLLVFICLGLGYVAYAFAFGKIPTPGEHKRLITRCDETDVTLRAVTDELADARVLSAEAKVRIEFMAQELANLKRENESLRSSVSRLETELDVRRANEWRNSQTEQDGNR